MKQILLKMDRWLDGKDMIMDYSDDIILLSTNEEEEKEKRDEISKKLIMNKEN